MPKMKSFVRKKACFDNVATPHYDHVSSTPRMELIGLDDEYDMFHLLVKLTIFSGHKIVNSYAAGSALIWPIAVW
jgi:hypothetical protein